MPGSPQFNPDLKNRDLDCKFPAKVQPGSFRRLAPDAIRHLGGSVAEWLRRWTCNPQVASSIPGPALSSNNLGQSCLHPRASAGRSGLTMA